MIGHIITIAWKELLHLRKDRFLIPVFVIGGILELSLIAWATGQPIDNIPMAVVDLDQSPQSEALIDALDASDTLTHKQTVSSVDKVYDLMQRNDAVLGVVIPEGYGAAVTAGERPSVRLISNGAEAVQATEAERTAQDIIFRQGMRDAYHMEPADYESELPKVTVKYNEDLKRGWYTLPAESGFIFYIFTVILASLAISRERERGTYEQLLVMPYRSIEVILGKALAPMLVGTSLFLAMMGLTVFAFGVPFRGSFILLLVIALLYLMAEMNKGVLMSIGSRTQLQAMLLVFVLAIVDMIFSGYAVAVDTMPPAIRTLSNFVPIRHWLIIVRGVMLKDVGLSVLWPHVAAILAIGVVYATITASQYRRHTD